MRAPTSPQAGLLRFATAGSVDDGKSTLIGRLLYDSRSLLADQVCAIEAASRRRGLEQADLSLITDGLLAEREQGITIDVAYRYFATPARKFIIADSPGHAQYTRNMVTAASTADLAVLLVDASKGLQAQTRRHAYLSSWVGIRRVVLAINKMDLVAHSSERFEALRESFGAFAAKLGFEEVRAIPISALHGDMVVERGAAMPWYAGPTLLEHLETVPARHDERLRPFRMVVQRAVRVPRGRAQPGSPFEGRDFRGYQGTIASGRIVVGDELLALGSKLRARVRGLLVADRPAQQACVDQAVTIELDREIDVSRGDLLVSPGAAPALAREVEAEICWFDAEPLDPGRPYLLKLGAQTVRASLAAPRSRVDVETLAVVSSPATLEMNDIGRVRVRSQRPLAFEPYRVSRATGAFIVVDEVSNRTVAAGTVAQDPR